MIGQLTPDIFFQIQDRVVQTQNKQYKALKEHIIQNTPKNEQKPVGKKLKEEQVRKESHNY
jgi:thousand and one amino acid protein kinase